MLTCGDSCSRCRRELLGSGRAAKSTSSLIQAASTSSSTRYSTSDLTPRQDCVQSVRATDVYLSCICLQGAFAAVEVAVRPNDGLKAEAGEKNCKCSRD